MRSPAEPPGGISEELATIWGVQGDIFKLDHYFALAPFGKGEQLNLVARGGHIGNQSLGGFNAVARLGGSGRGTSTQPGKFFASEVLTTLLGGIGLSGALSPGEAGQSL